MAASTLHILHIAAPLTALLPTLTTVPRPPSDHPRAARRLTARRTCSPSTRGRNGLRAAAAARRTEHARVQAGGRPREEHRALCWAARRVETRRTGLALADHRS